MKVVKIEEEKELDFLILGVNSHTKMYKLCWSINKKLKQSFIKKENHIPQNNKKQSFERFSYEDKKTNSQYHIVSNQSNFGCLDANNKNVNYFIVVQGGVYNSKKIIENLNQIDEILLVFELNLSKIRLITPFIIND